MLMLRRFLKDRKGAAAIEFALLAIPFFAMTFAIIEGSFMYFVDAGLDGALHRTARKVRVGSASANNWTLNTFKTAVCDELGYSFGCSANLLVRATVITDMSSVSKVSGISGGTLSVTEDFNIGGAGDYVLIQAFLPWTPIAQLYSYSSERLKDGSYVLGAAELFKNEPF